MEARVISMLRAAAWLGSERGMMPPWKRGPGPQTAPMTKEAFMFFANEIWDNWAQTRPGGHLTLIRGGRE